MSGLNRALVIRFVASATVGVVMAVAVGVVAARPRVEPNAPAVQPASLLGEDGNPIKFTLQKTTPTPLEPPPVTASIQLTSFHAAGPSPVPADEVPDPWWNSSVPRIPPVTQFDGGPLERVNCMMAAGAMLARLGYGVVTTGSQMRALQADQDGGTNHQNVQDAVRQGWGIRFHIGALSPLQLRALLFAGAGAVIDGNYGAIPENLRVQRSFTGFHGIYIDAFRPPGPGGQEAAYYVIDPIGRSWEGYRGAWWPAQDVERFAAQLPGGLIAALWAFPGGAVPADHPILPRDAYPTGPGATPRPGESLEPGESPAPGESPVVDPMPVDDLPIPPTEPVGEPPPPDRPTWHDFDFRGNVFEVKDPGLGECLAQPTPLGCPRGIVGIINIDGLIGPPATAPPIRGIDVLYATAIAPDTYQIILESPPDADADVWFWAEGGEIKPATVEEGFLDDRAISIATIVLDPATTYSFMATAEGDGVRSISTIGTLDVKS
jgi:hypothetical protein